MRGHPAFRAMRPVALLLACALLAGCTGGDDGGDRPTPTNVATYVPVSGLEPPTATPPTPTAAPTGPPPETRGLTIRALAFGQNTPLQHPGRLAITDAGSWADLWASLREDPTAPAPEVDFETESVLVALHGPGSSTCYAIRITGAWLLSREVRANVTTFGPEPGAVCGDAIVYPWHAVAVDLPDARAAWTERTATGTPPP